MQEAIGASWLGTRMRAGARGVAIGRNVFPHQDPVKMIMAIAAIVNKGKTAEEAIQILK
ncbi:MAG: hypothetical protein PHW87_02055 [Methanothrix sp.]|nr:hypothetical protein [Methanothrix sp.]